MSTNQILWQEEQACGAVHQWADGDYFAKDQRSFDRNLLYVELALVGAQLDNLTRRQDDMIKEALGMDTTFARLFERQTELSEAIMLIEDAS